MKTSRASCVWHTVFTMVVLMVFHVRVNGQNLTRATTRSQTGVRTLDIEHRPPGRSLPESAKPGAPHYALILLPELHFWRFLANDGTLLDDQDHVRRKVYGSGEELLLPPSDSVSLNPMMHMSHSGLIVGSAEIEVDDYFEDRAIYWTTESATAQWLPSPVGPGPVLYELPRSYASSASFVSNNGTIAGTVYQNGPPEDPVDLLSIWSNPGSYPISVSSDRDAYPLGVNSQGVVIGGSYTTGYFVGGNPLSFYPEAINDAGTVVGLSLDGGSGMIWQDGVTMNTGDFIGINLNSIGDVLGRIYGLPAILPADTVAMIAEWSSEDWARLKIPFSSAWDNLWPVDINDHGVVLGSGRYYNPNLPDGEFEYRDFLLVPAELAVDTNRDGEITLSRENNSDETIAETPFRFWINDDDDSGDVHGSDIPRQTTGANYADNVVNGTRDLIDFFPVFLDIKQLLTVLPPSSTVKYKLRQAESVLNCVYTNLTRDSAHNFHTKLFTDIKGFSDAFDRLPSFAVTHQITAAGFELSSAFLAGVRDSDWGVLLIESRAVTTAPLVLSVETDDVVIAEVKLELQISNVEEMFRHLNLRSLAKNYNGSPEVPSDLGAITKMSDPGDSLPDSTTNGKYFVFVHGYNVDAAQDRGWETEIFKRMFVMGSHARFVGVSWYGSTGVDYHKAVFHAFQTGDVLNGQLGLPTGADVTVVAHSLGNMVVSQAIQNGGFSPSRYYMVNAAVPLEAYDYNNGSVTADQRIAMTEHKWKTQSASTFSANWHQLLGPTASDHRNELKWKDRFNAVLASTALYNFYSPGDNVVENPEWDNASILEIILAQGFNFSRGAWATGEFAKGARISEFPAIALFSRVQGGWGKSVDFWPTGPSKQSTDQTREPYFGYFLEHILFDSDATRASTKAGEKIVQYDLLARGIPALSFAAAVNPLAPLKSTNRNFDMETQGRTNGTWPTEGHTADSKSVDRWLHSDFKNVALPYVYQMYQEMINRGLLQ